MYNRNKFKNKNIYKSILIIIHVMQNNKNVREQ